MFGKTAFFGHFKTDHPDVNIKGWFLGKDAHLIKNHCKQPSDDRGAHTKMLFERLHAKKETGVVPADWTFAGTPRGEDSPEVQDEGSPDMDEFGNYIHPGDVDWWKDPTHPMNMDDCWTDSADETSTAAASSSAGACMRAAHVMEVIW